MSDWLVLPVVIPLLTAVTCFALWRFPRWQGALSILGGVGLLASSVALFVHVRVAGVRATELGNWPAPFGITFVADTFASMMVLLGGIIGFAVVVYSVVMVERLPKGLGYHPLLHVMLAGVTGAFLTGDIFNLYVWFEVMLISSFVLLAMGGSRSELEGAITYLTLNLISSSFFLAAVGILYGVTGSLNMAELSLRVAQADNPAFIVGTSVLFMIAFGVKAAIFPLFFWLPASYHTPPAAVSALFAGLLTKVGVYAMIRVFTLLFTLDIPYTHNILLWVAGLTMISGVLGAASQNEVRKILSFHIVSQIGYMVMGLALFAPLALAGSLFYIAHHIIVKANLFLVSGIIYRLRGSYQLAELGGLYRDHPLLAIGFLIPALSLAGIPPLSGFFAKLMLIQSGFAQESFVIVMVALLVGLLTLFSMTKIWSQAFWKAAPAHAATASPGAMASVSSRGSPLFFAMPVASLCLLTLAIGFWPAPLMALALTAANQLLDPQEYIRTVLQVHR